MYWIRFHLAVLPALVLVSTACTDEPRLAGVEPATAARGAGELTVRYPGLHPVTAEPLTSIQEAIDAVIELTDCDGGSVDIAAGEYSEPFYIPNLAAVIGRQLPPGCRLPSVRGAGAGVTRIVADYASPQPSSPPHINVGGVPFFAPFEGASGDDRFFEGGELCCMEITRGSNAPAIAIGSAWTRGSAFRDIVIIGGFPHAIQLFSSDEVTVERNTLHGRGPGMMGTAIDVGFPVWVSGGLPEAQQDIRILDNIVVGAAVGIRTVSVQDAVIEGNAVDATQHCFFVGGSVDLRYTDNVCIHAQDPNGGNLRVLSSREIRWLGGCVRDAAAVVTLGFDDSGWPEPDQPWVPVLFEALGPARDILIENVLTSHVAEVVSDCPGSPLRGPECDAATPFGDRDIAIRGLVDDPSIDCGAAFAAMDARRGASF